MSPAYPVSTKHVGERGCFSHRDCAPSLTGHKMSFERHKLVNTARHPGPSQDSTSRDVRRLRSRAAFAGISIQDSKVVGQAGRGGRVSK